MKEKPSYHQTFLTVNQFCQKNSLTTGCVRSWIFNAGKNGFNKCIFRIGKKILISQEKFYQWMESNPAMPSNQKDVEMANKNLVEKLIDINERILVLSDENLGELFETGTALIKEQRHYTKGMIDALELILDREDAESSLKHLEMMMKERVK